MSDERETSPDRFVTELSEAARWIHNAVTYIMVLHEELRELVPLAAAQGWRSTRYETGRELRAKLGIKGDGDNAPDPCQPAPGGEREVK